MRLRGLAWWAGGALALLGAWHAAVRPLPPLARLEAAADDWRQDLLAPAHAAGPHPDILIVDIDEASLQAVGHWPWPRERIAALSRELLQRQQVAALAFDFVFPEAAEGDDTLAAAWRGQPVVAGFYLQATGANYRAGQLPAALASTNTVPQGWPLWTGYAASLPALAQAAPHAGFFNVLPDADGLVRSVPAAAVVQGQLQPSLALATLQLVTGSPAATAGVSAEWLPATSAQPRAAVAALRVSPPGQAARRLPVDEHGNWRVPFRGPAGVQGGSFRYLGAATVLAGGLPAASLAGRIVLLGSSAPGLADLRPTPAGNATPGVEVHAHLLAGLLDGALPYRPAWAPGYEVCLIALSLLLCGLAARLKAAPLALAGVAAVMALLLAANAALYAGLALVLPVASAVLLGAMLAALLVGQNYLGEWRNRRSLLQLFDQYLPPERARALAQELARDPAQQQTLQAENRELTLLFCDLQGFTALSEQLPPLALRDLLNHYFSTVTQVVHAHGGTLDKFIGDAVMAFWGAPQAQPDHAQRAVAAAWDLRQAAEPLNQRLRDQGLPAIRFGIGLASGVVCVGDLGSALRRSYTAVGDAVNLAARLEALTRELGAPLLVASSTQAACGPAPAGAAWLEVDQTQVRGRQQSVTVFTLAGTASPPTPAQALQLQTWALAQAAVRTHHAAQALALLADLTALRAADIPTPLASPAPTALNTVLAALCASLETRLRANVDEPPASASAT
ncbi:CHASE2 domain-containing protein [Ideonella azotifigens]|uniref:Adenylate/guanylate cyclase domain-containing protein n=2 Tax=Ideonella azotifigens TaxID=513160 RepID=A0ABN1JMK3_9BURK|nr:adenylate/guanylate cyclase domain-containing protein [Ideonella azotifigens]